MGARLMWAVASVSLACALAALLVVLLVPRDVHYSYDYTRHNYPPTTTDWYVP